MKRLLSFAVIAVPVALIYSLGGLEFLERARMDLAFRLAEREASGEVALVEIDPRSLQTLGVWPWPRGYHATVLERLLDAGARQVGFDIEFSSRSVADAIISSTSGGKRAFAPPTCPSMRISLS